MHKDTAFLQVLKLYLAKILRFLIIYVPYLLQNLKIISPKVTSKNTKNTNIQKSIVNLFDCKYTNIYYKVHKFDIFLML